MPLRIAPRPANANRVGAADVILFCARSVLAVDGELEIRGYPHARWPVEETADELPARSRIVFAELASQLPGGQCTVLNSPLAADDS